jgi:iron-sulfur cluster assembly 1
MSLKPLPSVNDDILELTIRFSASLPDLLLSISLIAQPYANTSTLKQLIRSNLPSDYSNRRIRLIYAGKALLDNAPLSASLKRSVSRPPSRVPTPTPYQSSSDDPSPTAKLKGKTPIRDPPSPQTRIYIHCSIGDVVLSPTELAAESALANPNLSQPTHPQDVSTPQHHPPPTSAPAPRGFDRLLSSGFTSTEIASLRLQFLSIQSHTHTPDTMPSPTTLRNMEDQWLDNSTSTNPSADSTGTGGSTGSFSDDEAGALDDMIFGTAMGFFWPIGCLMWGVKEEGVWSERRKWAVMMGVVLNVFLGVVRYAM